MWRAEVSKHLNILFKLVLSMYQFVYFIAFENKNCLNPFFLRTNYSEHASGFDVLINDNNMNFITLFLLRSDKNVITNACYYNLYYLF